MPGPGACEMGRRKPVLFVSFILQTKVEPGTGNMFEVQETQVNKGMFKVLCSTGAGHWSVWWIRSGLAVYTKDVLSI